MLLVGPASSARPVHAVVPVKSPATFVLPKRPKPMSLAQRAVTIARGQLGVPYRWGGASPSGFDCSGLVMWVYGRLGLSLPHNAAALFGVGRGRMIHAPQSGRTVEIQPLSARRSSFVGARRDAA